MQRKRDLLKASLTIKSAGWKEHRKVYVHYIMSNQDPAPCTLRSKADCLPS